MAIFMLLIHAFRIQLRSKFAKFVFVFCSRRNGDLIQLSITERILWNYYTFSLINIDVWFMLSRYIMNDYDTRRVAVFTVKKCLMEIED